MGDVVDMNLVGLRAEKIEDTARDSHNVRRAGRRAGVGRRRAGLRVSRGAARVSEVAIPSEVRAILDWWFPRVRAVLDET